MKRPRVVVSLLSLSLAAVACVGCGGDESNSNAQTSRGPIQIWFSNNAEEVAWGTQMVDAWNAEHPDEKVTAQEIPASKSSEEVISAAITAGNAPCLIYNTSPAAVPQFKKQGGLVALDDFEGAADYIAARTGALATQYQATDGKYYQLPWKSNPVMIFYNKQAFTDAGLDSDQPALTTYEQFLATSRQLVASGSADFAIWPSPTSEFYQSWFDFYPLYIAQSGGNQLVENGTAQFDSADGQAVAQFWRQMYEENLASQEKYSADAFADGKAAMVIAGPWAIATYKDKVDWGMVPVPTQEAKAADQIQTFSDAKNVAMFSACENQATAWDVLKFSTSVEQDGQLLETTGQMPMRVDLATTYPTYFAANPAYSSFAAQANRTVEVPQVNNSVEIWQAFRDAYSSSVIFGKEPIASSLTTVADTITTLAGKA